MDRDWGAAGRARRTCGRRTSRRRRVAFDAAFAREGS
jgi:hypothetical protein